VSLTLTVDGQRWRSHLRAFAANHPGLVPVAKGNGYGFGLGRLARKAQWLKDQGLDCESLAVGTYDELGEVAQRYDGDLLVLTPWRPFVAEPDPALAGRLVHTIGRLDDLDALLDRQPDAAIVLERMTSMMRHGFSARDLRAATERLTAHPAVRLRGVALHLPLETGSHLSEVQRLLNDVVAAGLTEHPGGTHLWVSHLTGAEQAQLRASYADFTLHPRIGTGLWLGDRAALCVCATVLDSHPVERGEAFGYRGRSAPKAGHILIVSGGTAHGIGLEAPMGESSIKARAATFARGGLDAVGFVRSPYLIDGKQRLFAEPPHMQASMLFLPSGARVPDVGEQIEVRVRFTATDVDHVVVT